MTGPPAALSPRARHRTSLLLSRRYRLWGVGATAVVVAAILTVASMPGSDAPSLTRLRPAPPGDAVLVAGGQQYDLQLARAPSQQRLGLADRRSLPKGDGVLLVYPSSTERCFSMNGVRFALDVIWLSGAGQVGTVERDVKPGEPMVFCSQGQDLVALSGGQAELAGISFGRVVDLKMPAK